MQYLQQNFLVQSIRRAILLRRKCQVHLLLCKRSIYPVHNGYFPTLQYPYGKVWRQSSYEVTPISEGLHPPHNLQNRSFCIQYSKTQKSEGLRPPQKLQNWRFSGNFKILFIIFNTPKLEVFAYNMQKLKNRRVCVHCKNSEIKGFAQFFGGIVFIMYNTGTLKLQVFTHKHTSKVH